MLKHAYSINETLHELGIGRSKLYAEIKAGKIEIRKIGKKSIILENELRRYLEELPISKN